MPIVIFSSEHCQVTGSCDRVMYRVFLWRAERGLPSMRLRFIFFRNPGPSVRQKVIQTKKPRNWAEKFVQGWEGVCAPDKNACDLCSPCHAVYRLRRISAHRPYLFVAQGYARPFSYNHLLRTISTVAFN